MPLVVKVDGRYIQILACEALQEIYVYLVTLDTPFHLK